MGMLQRVDKVVFMQLRIIVESLALVAFLVYCGKDSWKWAAFRISQVSPKRLSHV
jgi:hypothetical protein